MKFNEKLNDLREYLGISINKLGEVAGVSPTYISRIQNNSDKMPSKKIFLKITSAFMEKMLSSDGKDETLEKLFKSYVQSFITEDENLTEVQYEELQKLYKEMEEYFKNEMSEKVKRFINVKEDYYKNLIILENDNYNVQFFKDTDLNILKDKPIFDLKWLLSQDKYCLFYGRGRVLKTHNGEIHADYNVISKKDKEVIASLIDAYFKANYMGLGNPKEFFDNIFNKIIKEEYDIKDE